MSDKLQNPPPLDRRDFLRVTGTLAATTAMTAGCQHAVETSVPFHDRPEGLRTHGRAKTYATVIDGAPVWVKTREGRPILITPNPDSPSRRGLTVRTQAALLDLYDPDRAAGPLSVRRGQGAPARSSWSVVDAEVGRRLKGGKAALLTGPVTGPATRALIAELERNLGVRHVAWSPLANDAAAHVWRAVYGNDQLPRPRLDRADLIVGFGAEFIDRPGDGLESDFALRRTPGANMNRFVQLEGRLTLTGANADQRIRVRDSQLPDAAAFVAHAIANESGDLPLAQRMARLGSPEVLPESLRTALRQLASLLLAGRERSLVLAGGSASAGARGRDLERAVLTINHILNRYAPPLFDQTDAATPSGIADLAALTRDLGAGEIDTLLVAANPAYDAPLDFAEAAKKVDFIVSLADRIDETAALADYLAPVSHALEAWGDAEIEGSVLAVQQPVIRPLYDTRGLLDSLATWAAAAGDRNATDAVARSTPSSGPGYHYLRQHWLSRVLPATRSWDAVLRGGHLEGASGPPRTESFDPAGLTPDGKAPAAGELELQLYPHFALDDGKSGNNGWLHELPDPITRIAWGNAASIAPKRFDAMGLENGDLVEVHVDDRGIVLPAYRHAGMHEDQIAIPLGLGRRACGEIGAGVGARAFHLVQVAGDRFVRSGLPATLKKHGGREELALGQGADVQDRGPRPVAPITTLSEYQQNPSAGTEQVHGGKSAWPEHPYPNQRWGMAIDLSLCNGCGKCSLACQAENNIPVVGRQAIIDGREMAWMRIDRYYDAPRKEGGWSDDVFDGPLEVVEEPVTVFEPMLCQHCENAPCETVCPFNATMHSEDGLNQQAYNRCVGTRYCANNCPFKVRRYNWFEYSKPQTAAFFALLFPELERHAALNSRGRMQMKNNPEVTVRSRGVMEKCSFCVQRISEARSLATREGRDKDALPDGAVVPACMEACPTGAIVFGDINDPESRVSRLRSDPRAMQLLEATGVKPVISYLTKVRNDNA
jgi:molybdopterin-containing oxidoreductase family iron-sulfur binding subunit